MSGGDGIDSRSPRIDLVPIIDAMTCVIFFLLLSSTFVEYTKITMPSSVSAISAASVMKDPPIAPKMMALIRGNQIELILSWFGKNPDRIVKKITRDPNNNRSDELQSKALEAVEEFTKKFPNEKTILLGFAPKVTYQEVISTMDGARKLVPDLVLVSWTEAKLSETEAKE
jgi:biopolymer transport protein ExbD